MQFTKYHGLGNDFIFLDGTFLRPKHFFGSITKNVGFKEVTKKGIEVLL